MMSSIENCRKFDKQSFRLQVEEMIIFNPNMQQDFNTFISTVKNTQDSQAPRPVASFRAQRGVYQSHLPTKVLSHPSVADKFGNLQTKHSKVSKKYRLCNRIFCPTLHASITRRACKLL